MRLELKTFLDVVRHTPLVSVDLVVRDATGRILVGLRKNRPAKDCWFVPGGRICKNERISEALSRVTDEELGASIAIDEATFLGVYEHLYPDNAGDDDEFGTHYVVLAYELTVDPSSLKLDGDQHREYRWQTPEQLLAEKDVHPNTKAYCVSSPRRSRR